MYVKTNNGSVEIFPYTIGQFRSDNSNTSFPKNIPISMLNSHGVYSVHQLDQPSFDSATQKLVSDSEPTLIDGEWCIGYSVVDRTAEEIAGATEAQSEIERALRNSRLAACDWTQLADAPLTAEQKTSWATYRQSLRDITAQDGFPFSIEWPTEP